MNENEKLINFWNESFNDLVPSKITNGFCNNELFNSFIELPLKQAKTVLDYGCGTGWGLFELYLRNNSIKGYGIDPSFNAIKYCNGCVKENNIQNLKFIKGDSCALTGEVFDFIFSINVLDVITLDKMMEIIKDFKAHLSKDGYIFIGTNPSFDEETLTKKIGLTKVGRYYKKDGIIRSNDLGVDDYLKIFSEDFDIVKWGKFKLFDEEKYFRNGYLLKHK